jgi:hypothetical protein
MHYAVGKCIRPIAHGTCVQVLTLMQFWLPCECGEKVTLGLTVLLAYSVFSFNIAENMPETSEVIPLIGGCACMRTHTPVRQASI